MTRVIAIRSVIEMENIEPEFKLYDREVSEIEICAAEYGLSIPLTGEMLTWCPREHVLRRKVN
jgi:hypothetical protein